MSDKPQPRHEQLLSAGWIYDSASDRYSAPGSATDGTQRMYNLEAAWLAFSTDTAPMPPASTPTPPLARQRDPRQKEPE